MILSHPQTYDIDMLIADFDRIWAAGNVEVFTISADVDGAAYYNKLNISSI